MVADSSGTGARSAHAFYWGFLNDAEALRTRLKSGFNSEDTKKTFLIGSFLVTSNFDRRLVPNGLVLDPSTGVAAGVVQMRCVLGSFSYSYKRYLYLFIGKFSEAAQFFGV